jgi:Fe-S-cluster containining protein
MDIHFGCTQCGKCCRDNKIPLTVAEAIIWLGRGHPVQLLCEASPWSAALDNEPRARHFKRRSFAAKSGTMPTRIVLMLVANVVGACPNLLADMRCGIYQDRPLVCRIYPAEINPFVAFKRESKMCPSEAWTKDQPLWQRGGGLVDKMIGRDIEDSRTADARDVHIKSRLCAALNLVDTGLVHEGIVAYSPTVEELLSSLTSAMASDSASASAEGWRFVSDQVESVANISNSGGVAIHLRDVKGGAFEHFSFKRDAIFGVNPQA